MAQEQVRLVENSMERLERSLDETNALRGVGLGTDYDVLRLEVEMANLNPSLLQATSSVLELKRNLSIELALEESDGLAVSGSLARISLDDIENNSSANREILEFSSWSLTAENVSEKLLGAAQEDRPDLRTLDQSENLRNAELRIEQGR